MNAINVTSEIGKLKKVLLHRPGNELLNLTPDSLEQLLFDDIPFLKNAEKEHDAFASKLKENGVEVVYLEDLAKDVIEQSPEIRERFLRQYISETGVTSEFYKNALFDFFNDIKDPKELILKTMAGVKVKELGITNSASLTASVIDKNGLLVDPMPSLYFTRDPFACVGNGVTIHKMRYKTRCRETVYGEYIFNYHKDYAGKVPQFYDRYSLDNIEGGDILNISEKVLAIGISQRTSAPAIEVLANNIFFKENSPIETILAFEIPPKRAFMHLDTVFTQIDYDKFTIHPGILGPLAVHKITRGAHTGELRVEPLQDELKNILATYTGTDSVDLIQCAGGDKIAAEREQWNDGSNTLCIKPGTVIVYDRNDITNELLVKKGIKVIEIASAELSRGRGGPRCMSMPIIRE